MTMTGTGATTGERNGVDKASERALNERGKAVDAAILAIEKQFGRVPFGGSFFGHRHLSVTLLIRSSGPLAGADAMPSAGRSAFLRVVLDDGPFLARLANDLDVLRWLRQRRQARLAGLLLRLLLLFAWSIP